MRADQPPTRERPATWRCESSSGRSPEINLSCLADDKKRSAFEHLKQTHPAVVDLIKDPFMQSLMTELGGHLFLESALLEK